MRKCRLATCRLELPKVKDSDWYQKNGFCGNECMASHGLARARATIEKHRRAEAAKERKEHREAKDRIKSRSDWLKEAQIAFNAFIRARDEGLPCVSCGRHHQGQNHAGHYRSVGSEPSLRFCEDQVWLQCAPCNTHLSGNLINYRIELLRRVGEEKLAWIEGPHEPKKYTIDDLKAIKVEYKLKLKELRREAA